MKKIVFMGSPDFALTTLRALAQAYDIVGVVTQPDRASGRGRELKSPPVKRLAQELNLPIMQPEKLKAPEAMEQLQAWAPDLIVVAAFGQILKKDVLDLPALRLHQRSCFVASALARRGAHQCRPPRWG